VCQQNNIHIQYIRQIRLHHDLDLWPSASECLSVMALRFCVVKEMARLLCVWFLTFTCEFFGLQTHRTISYAPGQFFGIAGLFRFRVIRQHWTDGRQTDRWRVAVRTGCLIRTSVDGNAQPNLSHAHSTLPLCTVPCVCVCMFRFTNNPHSAYRFHCRKSRRPTTQREPITTGTYCSRPWSPI